MFSTPVRVALIVTSLVVGLIQVASGNWSGLALVLAAALFAYGHYRYGPVWLAFRALRAGKLERAERLLSQVKRPAALASGQRAYFELASGSIAATRGHDDLAEQHLRTALDHKLRTENDRCLAEAELARLVGSRGDRAEARELIARARSRRSNQAVAEHVERIAASLDSPE